MNTEGIFEQLFGGVSGRESGRRNPITNVAGDDELYHLDIEFKEAVLGSEKMISLPNGKKLQVKIPAGIEEGQKLKFKGFGGLGIGKGPPGDAYVQISIKKLPGFQRSGQDILTDLPISMFEAVSGAEIEVPTIDGSVMLKIPPGVSTGFKLRIREKGVGSKNMRGSQIVTLNVVMPKEINPAFRDAINNLSKEFSYSPRTMR
ncbi:MAG: J domain-containing protein [Bdellovibrionota bacterium]